MIDDALGLKGIAQVLQKPNVGNLYALAQMKANQQQKEAELAQKRQEQNTKDFVDSIKLSSLPVLESKPTEMMTQARSSFLNNVWKIYKDNPNGLSPAARQTISSMKQTVENTEDQAQSFQNDVDQSKQAIKSILPIANEQMLAKEFGKVSDNVFSRQNDGSLTFNKQALVNLREIQNKPEIYDPQKMAANYVKDLGDISQDLFSPDANVSDQRKFSNVFLLKKNGTPELDVKTGRPLIDSSPEAIAKWNAKGQVWEDALKMYADKDFGGDVQKAHSSLMRSVADYSSVKSKINSPVPGYGSNFNAPELSNAFTGASNSLDQIRKNGGVSGYSGKEANLQWFGTPDQRTVRLKDQNGKDVDGEILKFGIGNVGNGAQKGVWVAQLDAKGTGRQSVFIPIHGNNDPNLKTVLDASFKFDKKGNVRNDVLNQWNQVENSPVKETNIDESKVSDVISSIGDSFKKTDSGYPSDEDVSREIADKLKSLGVTKVKTTTSTGAEKEVPLKVSADVANWFGSHKLKINGKEFDLDDPDKVNEMTQLIYDNSNPEHFNDSGATKKLSIADQMKKAAK